MINFYGIAGLTDKKLRREYLQYMYDTPNKKKNPKIYQDDSISIACCSVTPFLPNENGVIAEDDYVIAGEVLIKSRNELAEITGKENQKKSDIEIVLDLYKKFGCECLKFIYGEFAFVLYDKNRNELLMARDSMGFCPLYYLINNDMIYFSSNIPAFFELPFFTRELDEKTIVDYLLDLKEEKERTFYREIKKLPSASFGFFHKGEIKKEKYYEWKWRKAHYRKNKKSILRTFSDLLKDSINKCDLITSNRALLFSGGVDSSTIAALLNKTNQPETISAYSYVLPANHVGPEEDDKAIMEAVAEKIPNLKVSYLSASSKHPFSDVENTFRNYGQPLFSKFSFVFEDLIKKAKSENVSLLLNGFGGDIIASAYGHGVIRELITQKRFLEALTLYVKTHFKTAKWIFVSGRRKDKSKNTDFLEGTALNKTLLENNQELLDRINSFKRKQSEAKKGFKSSIQWKLNSGSLLNALEELSFSHKNKGIMVQIPLLDPRLVKYLLNIPVKYFLLSGKERGLLLSVMKKELPRKLLKRKFKTPVVPDYFSRMKNHSEEMAKLIEKTPEDSLAWKYLAKRKMISQIKKVEIRKPGEKWDNKTFLVLERGLMILNFIKWNEEKRLE